MVCTTPTINAQGLCEPNLSGAAICSLLAGCMYTGGGVCLGTTFRASTEPQSDLTKIQYFDQKKIFTKSTYNYRIYFLRNHF